MVRDLFNPKTVVSDCVAGLTLGIESIPDAMASGLLAAVNPIHAVYAVMLATPPLRSMTLMCVVPRVNVARSSTSSR